MSAWEAGLLLAPQGLGAAAGSVLVNRTINKAVPRTLVVAGIVLILIGTAPFTQLGHDLPDTVIAASLALRGIGIGMVGAPVMNIVYSRTEPEQLPRASGALNLLNTVGGSVGTAAHAVVLQNRLSARGPDVPAAFGDTFWRVLGFCQFRRRGGHETAPDRGEGGVMGARRSRGGLAGGPPFVTPTGQRPFTAKSSVHRP
ncbi:MFS transporter [Streptomyces sp. NPDC091387]|uniref:MFS transporter n=1 Tax=Streptomyces sp. NPDC091387 TaxID=3365998 RepID=UPI00380BAF76